VKLSNIARTLKEEQALIKTEDRLSRNLDDEDFTEVINEEICRLGASKVTDEMVIAIDPGDIRKKYASTKDAILIMRFFCNHRPEVGKNSFSLIYQNRQF